MDKSKVARFLLAHDVLQMRGLNFNNKSFKQSLKITYKQ